MYRCRKWYCRLCMLEKRIWFHFKRVLTHFSFTGCFLLKMMWYNFLVSEGLLRAFKPLSRHFPYIGSQEWKREPLFPVHIFFIKTFAILSEKSMSLWFDKVIDSGSWLHPTQHCRQKGSLSQKSYWDMGHGYVLYVAIS